MRGPTIHDESGIKDPLLRAIAEMRDQVDRLIEEQKAAFGGYLSSFVEEPSAPERPLAGAPSTHSEPPLATVAPPLLPEPAPRTRKVAQPSAFDRVDDPSPTPPRPASPPAVETPVPAAAGRPDDPRERLDALAKHLDRKLKQAGGSPADSSVRPPE